MLSGKLSDYGIGKEATIHMIEVPPIKIIIEFEGKTQEISVPNNPSVTIRDVKRYLLEFRSKVQTFEKRFS